MLSLAGRWIKVALREEEIKQGNTGNGEETENLAAGNELQGKGWLEDTCIIGKLVPESAYWRGEDIANQKGEDDFTLVHYAVGEQRPGRSQTGGKFGGHMQDDNGHGLGGEPGEKLEVRGHEFLQMGKDTHPGQDIEEYVNGYGETDDLADPALEAFPGPLPGALQIIFLARLLYAIGYGLGPDQQEMADQADT